MAIGYGVAVPKGKTRKQLKARKDREDAKQLKAFRDAVWKREETALMGYASSDPSVGHCQSCGVTVTRSYLMVLR